MNLQQEETLHELLTVIPLLVNDKFRRGDKEHDSDIQDMTVEELVNNVSEKLIDATIYALLAIKKLREFKGFMADGRPTGRIGSNLSKT